MPPGTTVLLVNGDTLEVTATDWEGFFSLPASPGDTLIAHFFGMQDYQTIITDSTDTLHIALADLSGIQGRVVCICEPLHVNYRHTISYLQGSDSGHGAFEYRYHVFKDGTSKSKILKRIVEPGISWYRGEEHFYSLYTQINDFRIGQGRLFNSRIKPYVNLGWTFHQRFDSSKPRVEAGLELHPMTPGRIMGFHINLDARYRFTQMPTGQSTTADTPFYLGLSFRYKRQ